MILRPEPRSVIAHRILRIESRLGFRPGGERHARQVRNQSMSAAGPGALSRRALAPAAILALLLGPGILRAQEQHKKKVPGLGKITGGPNRQAFSGKVASLDLERHLLNVNTVEGGNLEIFPVKKKVQVTTADGEKLKLIALTPGTNVIIYYEQRGDRRTVKNIVVLAAGADEEKKKSPPPS